MKERFFKNKELNNKKFLKFKKISNFREHSIRNSNLNCQYKLKIYNITNKLIIKKKKNGKNQLFESEELQMSSETLSHC